ncbi:MAG: hypothetical protein HY047_13895, partial [Acidobacteria bacterium]|nr:hypothetical protein [Acidobacteriota bacterium]
NAVNTVLARSVSATQRDLVLVIVNDNAYGGSGGAVAVASTNTAAVELVLHESGHTLGLLADEYTDQPPVCSLAVEPSAANATMQTQRAAIKWTSWIEASTPLPRPRPRRRCPACIWARTIVRRANIGRPTTRRCDRSASRTNRSTPSR